RLVRQDGGECTTPPLGRARALLEGVSLDEATEVPCAGARPLARSPGPWAVQHALGPLLGKALHPCAESRIGTVEGRGDGVDAGACDDLTDGLRTAKAPGLLRLFEQGL